MAAYAMWLLAFNRLRADVPLRRPEDRLGGARQEKYLLPEPAGAQPHFQIEAHLRSAVGGYGAADDSILVLCVREPIHRVEIHPLWVERYLRRARVSQLTPTVSLGHPTRPIRSASVERPIPGTVNSGTKIVGVELLLAIGRPLPLRPVQESGVSVEGACMFPVDQGGEFKGITPGM